MKPFRLRVNIGAKPATPLQKLRPRPKPKPQALAVARPPRDKLPSGKSLSIATSSRALLYIRKLLSVLRPKTVFLSATATRFIVHADSPRESVQARVAFAADVCETGTIAVPAKVLRALLKGASVKDESLIIRASANVLAVNDNEVELTDNDEKPLAMPKPGGPRDASALLLIAGALRAFLGESDATGYEKYRYLHIMRDGTAIATDTYRLAAIPAEVKGDAPILIVGEALGVLEAAYKTGAREATLYHGKNVVDVVAGNWWVRARHGDYKLPDWWPRVVPSPDTHTAHWTISTEQALDVLAEHRHVVDAAWQAKARPGGEKHDVLDDIMWLEANAGTLQLRTQRMEAMTPQEDMAVHVLPATIVEGDDMKVGLNPYFVRDALRLFAAFDTEEVTIHVVTPKTAVVFTPYGMEPGDGVPCAVVMPRAPVLKEKE